MALQLDHIDAFTQKRILAYLNGVRTAEELTGGAVLDSPESGTSEAGYTIGETVAQRIISLRNRQRGRRFASLTSLNDVDGFGQDKLNDLAYSFRDSAEARFQASLFDGLLYDNWTVTFYDEQFEDAEAFQNIAGNRSNLEDWIIAKVREGSFRRFGDRHLAYVTSQLVRDRYVEVFEESHLGSYAWALWFYRFDQDNWFSFERMREAVETFLSTYQGISEEIELHLVKGYPAGGLTQGITPDDLPVTINHAEQRIAVWTAELFD